ncbi:MULTISPECIES: glycosyltransferase [unclassified Ruminococcus]|uniref:glycosyltransferase family 2 protein n=1 Tax=unclassified Ruminococcus TaxID=2608920 RepID=UPI00210B1275|nr:MULTISPECIES: glycosyltransferase [unclassified Ruminococcus]MCQ4022209.1 glycosyltransferase [Ruminococcus sp. zg-924]MCQ4115228.1 glycosyltransferase [Ruminococcus sp. zg-921]
MNETVKKDYFNREDITRDNMPEVSVIVPVYNVDMYLKRCIDSIINQIFTNIEIILVNDGSLDNSPQICDDYARLDSRIKVIHKKNGGLSDARNAGIAVSTGKYLAFIDSDDYVDPSYIAVLYYAAKRNNCDMSYCNYAIYKQDKGTHKSINVRKPLPGVTNGKRMARLTMRDFRSRAYVWNKLYKRELFFNEDQIRYPKMYFEDTATTVRLMYHADSVVVVDKCLYYYTKRPGSIVSHLDIKKMSDYINALGVLRNFLEKHGDYKHYKWSHRWLGTIMFFAMPFNIVRALLLEKNKDNLFKKSFKGIVAGWKCILKFTSKHFEATDEVVPEMPYPLVEE